MVEAGTDGSHVKGTVGNQASAKHCGYTDEELDCIINDDIH